jgi:hypothetical protein
MGTFMRSSNQSGSGAHFGIYRWKSSSFSATSSRKEIAGTFPEWEISDDSSRR